MGIQPSQADSGISEAIIRNDFEVFKWFIDEGGVKLDASIPAQSWIECAKKGGLAVFEYAIERGLALIPAYYSAAIESKNSKLVELLQNSNCPINYPAAFSAAASVGWNSMAREIYAKTPFFTPTIQIRYQINFSER